MLLSHDNLMTISERGVQILSFHWNSSSFKLQKPQKPWTLLKIDSIHVIPAGLPDVWCLRWNIHTSTRSSRNNRNAEKPLCLSEAGGYKFKIPDPKSCYFLKFIYFLLSGWWLSWTKERTQPCTACAYVPSKRLNACVIYNAEFELRKMSNYKSLQES